MHVVPRTGFAVLDPDTFESLPVEGKQVPEITYWFRRLADGDVSLQDITADKNVPSTKAAKQAAKSSEVS